MPLLKQIQILAQMFTKRVYLQPLSKNEQKTLLHLLWRTADQMVPGKRAAGHNARAAGGWKTSYNPEEQRKHSDTYFRTKDEPGLLRLELVTLEATIDSL